MCDRFYDFAKKESDLRTVLDLVKLAVLEMRAILLSTTVRPPIKSPPPPMSPTPPDRKLEGNQATPLVVWKEWGERGSLDEGERGPFGAASLGLYRRIGE